MAYYPGRTLVLIFSFLSVSLLIVYTEEISPQGSSSIKDSAEIKKKVLPSNLSVSDVDSADFMLMDVTAGTTPTICKPGSACAFQPFKRVNGGFQYDDALLYCYCPEHQVCAESGMNINLCFFHFACRNETEFTTTTEDAIRTVSTSSMVPQNSATEPGQPVPFKFEGEFPPSMNC